MYYTIECKKCALSLESRRNSSTTRCTARYPGCWNIIHLEFLSYSVPQLRDENLKQVFGAAKHCYRFSRSVEKMLRSTARAVSEQVLDEYSSSSPSKTRNYPPCEYTSTRVHRVLYNTFQTPLVRETEEEIERKSVTGISGLANFRTRLLRHLHVG